jgi:hypothetical protein
MLTGTLLLGLGLLVAGADSPELRAGRRMVEEGDLAGAVARLEEVLRSPLARPPERARAHLYLAMAELGLGNLDSARAHMRAVWQHDPTLVLEEHEYAPPVIALHRDARPPARPPARHLPALIGLGGVAAVTGVGMGGGAEGQAGPPPGPAPARDDTPLLRLSNCDDECRASVNGVPLWGIRLNGDSGWIDLRPYLREGRNEITFELVNRSGGIAYGFDVRRGDQTVFHRDCGVALERGCENGRRYPTGVVAQFVYTLVQRSEEKRRRPVD